MRSVFTCPLTATGRVAADSTCIKQFADKFGFTVVATVANGNCFYDSLRLFFKRSNMPEETVQSLRTYMVDYLLTVVNENIISRNEIEQLYQSGVYNCDAGDLPPAFANQAFRINLKIYDLQDKKVDLHSYPYANSAPTAHFLRTGAHYRLLWPKTAKNVTQKRKKPVAGKKENFNMAYKLSQLTLSMNKK